MPLPQKTPCPVGEVETVGITPFEQALTQDLNLSDDGLRSMLYLSRTAFFPTYLRVGRDSKFPPQIVAFQRLLHEPQANRAFHRLVHQPYRVGGLYGLCGLYFTDPESFAGEAEQFRDCNTPVFTMVGAMGRFTTVSAIVFGESSGADRRRSLSPSFPPNDPGLREERENLSDGGLEPVLDISGGGYPRFLRDASAGATNWAPSPHSSPLTRPPASPATDQTAAVDGGGLHSI